MTVRKSSTLGKQLSFHPITPRTSRKLRWMILAAAAALAGFGIWRWYIGYTQFGVAAGAGWSRPWLAAAALLLAALALDWFRRRRLSRRFAAVHKNGLKTHLPGLKSRTLHWEEIAGIAVDSARVRMLGLDVLSRTRLIVTTNVEGEFHMGTELHDLAGLIANVKQEYYTHVAPRLQAELAAKKPLYFGPVSLNQNAITVNGQTAILDEIERIHVDSGKLRIDRRGKKTLSIRADKIPNLELLLKMVESL